MVHKDYISFSKSDFDELLNKFTEIMNTEVIIQGDSFPRATVGTYALALFFVFVLSMLWSFIFSMFHKKNQSKVKKKKPRKNIGKKRRTNRKATLPICGSNMLSSLETPIDIIDTHSADQLMEEVEDSEPEPIRFNREFSETETETETDNEYDDLPSTENSELQKEDLCTISEEDELLAPHSKKNAMHTVFNSTKGEWNYEKKPLFAPQQSQSNLNNNSARKKIFAKTSDSTQQKNSPDKENFDRSFNRLPCSPKPVLPLLSLHGNKSKDRPIKN